MKVIVNENALLVAMHEMLLESQDQGEVEQSEPQDIQTDEEPILASPVMSTQLVVDRPPVEDPDFIPTSQQQLSRSASVISDEVPDDQINFFYRKLHDLLDQSIDRSNSTKYEESEPTESEEGDEALEAAQEDIPDEEDAILETMFKKAISLMIEQEENDDESPFESEEAEEAYGDRYISSMGDPIEGLSDAVFNFEMDTVERWISSGANSDMRRSLEVRYPYLFDKSISQMSKVAEILDDPLSDALSATVSQTGNQPDTIKILVGRHHQQQGYSQHGSTNTTVYTPEQIQINQRLAKELDEFLPEMTYQDIIKLYEERLTDKSLEPLLANGYKDMIAIVRGRIYDEKKRERTDLSVKISRRDRPRDEEEIQLEMCEEERLKTLDSLAPYFGFKNASGIRQWRRKFCESKFKAMMGSAAGHQAYGNYAERVMENMAALLDEFAEISQRSLDSFPDDSELDDSEIALKQGILHINEQFQAMLQASLDDEDGNIPSNMLSGAAGNILRLAFADVYFDQQSRDFAKNMKDHMVLFLVGLGIDQSIANKFAKMFNGEVDLVALSDDSASARKLVEGGITADIYKAAVQEEQKFISDFFTGDHQKRADQQFLANLRDKKKLVKLFEKSIDAAISSMETEDKIDQALQAANQEEQETNLEENLKKMIKSIMRM